MKYKMIIFLLGCFFSLIGLAGNVHSEEKNQMEQIILIGSSIGEKWKFEDISQRINMKNKNFIFISHYDNHSFENAKKIASKGDSVILKLCAANFRVYEDKDYEKKLNLYKKQMLNWINSLSALGIKPIPATVIPITKELPTYYKLRHFAKKYILFRGGKNLNRDDTNDLIANYNDWLKDYVDINSLQLFDLEMAVRDGNDSRALKASFSTDGLHLNIDGYNALDKMSSLFFH